MYVVIAGLFRIFLMISFETVNRQEEIISVEKPARKSILLKFEKNGCAWLHPT